MLRSYIQDHSHNIISEEQKIKNKNKNKKGEPVASSSLNDKKAHRKTNCGLLEAPSQCESQCP